MSATRVGARRSRTRNRILAIAAAGTVLAAGITIPSLAAWTDTEWVTGGVDNDPGITTSTFNVQQRTEGDTFWDDYITSGGANVIDFSDAAAALTPGDTVYGYVRLQTVTASLGGTLTLKADTVVTPATLSAALTWGAKVMPAHTTCTAADYATNGTVIQAPGTALNTSSDGTLTLAAGTAGAPGTEQTVCFAITFPGTFSGSSGLQGQTVAPLWHFDAVSTS